MGQRSVGEPAGKLRQACRDLYRPAPSKEEAAQYGLTVEEASSVVYLWPDNVEAINLFISMLTQWRVGMNGATGLDYGVVRDVLAMNKVHEKRWPELFGDLRVLEDEALRVMREKARRNG